MRRARAQGTSSQRGQILVIVAGGMIGLLTIVAFVLEGGTMILNRRDAQNASDLASVAGARVVALNYTETPQSQQIVWDAIESNVFDNNCPATAPCTWEAEFVGAGLTSLGPVADLPTPLPVGALGVRVGVTRTPEAIVGKIIGYDSWTVQTEATATAERPSQIPDGILLPIALCGWTNVAGNDCVQASNGPNNQVQFDPKQIWDITDGKDAPGGFGWLSWTGSNAAGALSDSVCDPDNIPFSIDSPYDDPGSYGGVIGTNPATGETWFPADPGKSNKASMRACLDEWIASELQVLIPVYDIVTGNGNNAAYHITGVASFILYSREQPAVDNIQGYFQEYYPFPSIPGGAGAQPPQPGDTTVFIGLVK